MANRLTPILTIFSASLTSFVVARAICRTIVPKIYDRRAAHNNFRPQTPSSSRCVSLSVSPCLSV